ncbi:MAG: 5'-methylthioadenosine/S-adenosylhomocysteine nucleosidase [Acidobacteriota bacterium]|nr:5'-methylthioadenosine/S-adenosylhomocysteine nucleosidase [Acidobacteriota bacterium]
MNIQSKVGRRVLGQRVDAVLSGWKPIALVIAALVLVTVSFRVERVQGQANNSKTKIGEPLPPVVVQGAMPIEVELLVKRLESVSEEKVGGWMFWRGTVNGYPVVISKTLKGMSNTAAATAIAIERFKPVAIINQGTAGGHDTQLNVFDIVIGEAAINLGAFKTGVRKSGQGSDSVEWVPMDLLASEGSAGEDPNARTMRRFNADEQLLAAADKVKDSYRKGKVVHGVIGSSDVWNSELDRINRFHKQFGTSVEEMETASAAQIAKFFNVPFLGIRVLSNNITNNGKYNGTTALACQEYVFEVVKAYIAIWGKH